MHLPPFLFNGWARPTRAVLLALLAYGALVVLLRASGKRTLSKMNVFDFVFVVALGSSLASTVLSSDVSLAEGVATFAALIALQIVLSWLCVRSERLERFINGEPALILHRGQMLRSAMKRHRVTEEEIRAAARADGFASLEAVEAVVLETDGTFSVVWQRTDLPNSALRDVPGTPAAEQHEGAADRQAQAA